MRFGAVQATGLVINAFITWVGVLLGWSYVRFTSRHSNLINRSRQNGM